MRLAFLALPGLLACAASAPATPPPPPEPVVARIVATLEEAARLDRANEGGQAVAAWRRAHDAFAADLEPRLREVHPPEEVALTEYQFGRVRSEIDQAKGAPSAVIKALGERLREQIVPLVADPPES